MLDFDFSIPGLRAGEDLKTGDFCRIRPDGTVTRLRDGEGFTVSDVVVAEDAPAQKPVEIRRVRTRVRVLEEVDEPELAQ